MTCLNLDQYSKNISCFFFFPLGFRYRFLMKRNNVTSLRQEIRRQRRNNILLLLIVSIYTISWLPFNISYILFTYADRFRISGLKFPKKKKFVEFLFVFFLFQIKVFPCPERKPMNYQNIFHYVF